MLLFIILTPWFSHIIPTNAKWYDTQEMPLSRILQHVLILVYLAATLSGISYALFRVLLPGVPLSATSFSYQMIAPFQQYRTFNEEFVLEGRLADGSWKRIPLEKYLPLWRIEKPMSSVFWVHTDRGEEALAEAYKTITEYVWRGERAQGEEFESIRFYRETWPMDPDGYEAKRLHGVTEQTLLLELP